MVMPRRLNLESSLFNWYRRHYGLRVFLSSYLVLLHPWEASSANHNSLSTHNQPQQQPAFLFRRQNLSKQNQRKSFLSTQTTAPSTTGTTSTTMMSAKRDSPSAQRNKEPIWDVLSTKVFPAISSSIANKQKTFHILEVAAGCGVHTEFFSKSLRSYESFDNKVERFVWYPTDPTLDSLESIQCYINDHKQLTAAGEGSNDVHV